MMERRHLLMVLSLSLALLPLPSFGAGSWIANVTGPSVSRADADIRSLPLTAPPSVSEDRQITSVSWQFSLPSSAHRRVTAQLCHPLRCVPLQQARGTTDALAGLAADTPLAFHFRLVATGPAVQAKGLQVIVNYR